MKKDIGSRSFVEMYLITKEDKNLFDKCVNHMSQNARGKPEGDFSSTVLSQDPTLYIFCWSLWLRPVASNKFYFRLDSEIVWYRNYVMLFNCDSSMSSLITRSGWWSLIFSRPTIG